MFEFLTFVDLIVPPIYFIIFYFIAQSIKIRNIETNSSYKYYYPGLLVKLMASVLICLVYVFYYEGGDTTSYYRDCVAISKSFMGHPFQMIKLSVAGMDEEVWRSFDSETGWPMYCYDPYAFWVDRLVWPLCLVSFQSFIATTMLLSFICYQAIWRLFQTLVYEFPNLQRQMAIAMFFIPSVVFWGSGILKDSITFAAVALFISSFHTFIKLKKQVFKNIVFMVFASFILIKIKPYIFFALLPGTTVWFAGLFLAKVENKLLKASIAPMFLVVAAVAGYLVLGAIGNSLGDYRLENVLFRPYLWEGYNPGMLASGIENFVILILTIYLILRIKVFNLFRLMFRHHFLFLSVTFSLFFAFSVGLTTSNFGSLVRYKIPAMPLYVASLYIIFSSYKELKAEDKEKVFLKDEAAENRKV